MNSMHRIKRKIVSIKKTIFRTIFVFFILFGLVLPFNSSLNLDKNDRNFNELKLQTNNYSYCIEWYSSWDFSVPSSLPPYSPLKEKARLIAINHDGDNLIAGGYYGYCSPGEWEGDAFIVKLNNLGDYFWNKTLSAGSGQSYPEKLYFNPDNDFYIFLTGEHGMLCESYDHRLYKFDQDGNHLFSIKNYSSDKAFSMALDSMENIYIVGQTYANGKMFISKYNQSGIHKFFKTYNVSGYQSYDITTDSKDNIYIINEKMLMKYNSDGNLIWTKNISDYKKLRIDKNDKIYILANSQLFKFDEDGNKLWQMNTTSSLLELDADNHIYLLESNELIKLYTNGSIDYLFLDKHISAFCIDYRSNIYTTGIYNSDFIVKKYGIDTDHDNLTDWSELYIYYTNPNMKDSDGDDLSDGAEINIYLTDPKNPDSDDDGLNDGEEVNIYFTNPNDQDSDDDGLNDGEEVKNGFDPNNKFSNPFIFYTSIIVPISIVVSITAIMIIILKKKHKANLLI